MYGKSKHVLVCHLHILTYALSDFYMRCVKSSLYSIKWLRLILRALLSDISRALSTGAHLAGQEPVCPLPRMRLAVCRAPLPPVVSCCVQMDSAKFPAVACSPWRWPLLSRGQSLSVISEWDRPAPDWGHGCLCPCMHYWVRAYNLWIESSCNGGQCVSGQGQSTDPFSDRQIVRHSSFDPLCS